MASPRIGLARAASFLAFSLAFLACGCREQEAEKRTPTEDGGLAVTGAPPQIPPEGKTIAPSGGPPLPYWIRATCAAFSPDGKRILVGFGRAGLGKPNPEDPTPAGCSLRLFDVETGKHLRTLNGHKADVLYCAFFPNGKTAVSTGVDKMWRVWDIDNGVQLRAFPGAVSDRDTTALLPDGKHLLCYSGRRLELWDVTTEKVVEVYEDQKQKAVTHLAVSSNGNFALVGSPGYLSSTIPNVLELWDLRKWEIVRSFDPEKGPGAPSAFSEDSTLAMSTSTSKSQKGTHGVLWEVPSGKQVKEIAFPIIPESVRFSVKENRIVVAGQQGDLICLDAKSGREQWWSKGPLRPRGPTRILKSGGFTFFVFSADAKMGFSAFGAEEPDNGRQRMDMTLWDTETGKELRALRPAFESYRPPVFPLEP